MISRIVLIDDDVDDGGLFGEALRRVAPLVSLHYFNEAVVALQHLLQQSNPLPDIIFLDINMPVMNGWECLAVIAETEHLRALPVIIYSTSTDSREIRKARERGAIAYVTKPDDFGLLKQLLASITASPLNKLAGTLASIRADG